MSQKSPETELETRERLLAAAGHVFAEVGFKNATIRDICDRAGANIAAVNYHFQGKEHLYEAVLQQAKACAFEKYPIPGASCESVPPRERLLAFIRSFLLRVLDQGRPSWHGKLMAREMIEPTVALDRIVDQAVRPQQQALASIIRSILGERVDEEAIRLHVCSIVGQCVFHHHARPVIDRLFPQQRYDAAFIERLAGHITDFSYRAMCARREELCGASEGAA